MRWGSVLAVVIGLSLVYAATAAGQGYGGPWEAGHEPPTITSAGVTAKPVGDTFHLSISFAVLAPSTYRVLPVTVSFSDPSGVESVSISPPGDEPCPQSQTLKELEQNGECHLAEWTQPAHNPQVDFTITAGGGELPDEGLMDVGDSFWLGAAEVQFTPGVMALPQAEPFFYQIVGPAGVIAQGAMTVTQKAAETVHSHDLSPCIDSGHGLHSENGELYCEQTLGGGDSFGEGGWPSPPMPAAAAKPKAKYPALTLLTATKWSKLAVEYHFRYIPQHFSATHCVRRAAGRYRCNVSWLHGADSFTGAVEVGNANVYTVRYTYGLHVVRTDLRTHQRHTFAVTY
jgi:hypothetical protein